MGDYPRTIRETAEGPAGGFPQFMEREDITEAQRGVVGNVRSSVLQTANSPIEPIDQWIELCQAELVQSPQIGDDLDADLSGLAAVALDQLQVAATAQFSDARVHGRTIHRTNPLAQAHN